MSYEVTRKKVTFDGELEFHWTYKNVRELKTLPTSIAISEYGVKRWIGCKDALKSMIDGTAKYPVEIINQDFGIITAYMDSDCLEFNIYDGDSYSDELDHCFEDGIQETVEFKLNKKDTKKCMETIKLILGEQK